VSWENPQVPHEVNVARESVLGEFVRLAAGLAVVVVAAAALLWAFGGALARLVPFATERAWVGDRVLGLPGSALEGAPDEAAIEPYLQRLADSLARPMELPDGMRIRVHYSSLGTPNAFATLGGHVVVTRGLYERMPSENALAMVIAHEIAHVRARDPIAALGGGASVAVVLVLLGGSVDRLTPYLAQAVQLGYSRRAERRADAAAVEALRAVYGHAGGAAAVFEVLRDWRGGAGLEAPEFLSTHPADDERIAALRAAATDWDAARQPLVPLAVAAARPGD
jgi:Zn-dependent protease with chaperone function